MTTTCNARCLVLGWRLVLGLLLVPQASACAYARVAAGEVAVVRTPEGVRQKVYPTGDWPIGLWDTAAKYSVRSQGNDEQLEVLAANGLRIILDASIRYHLVASEAVQIDQELGENYYAVLIGPTLRSQARRVVGRFTPEEIYSTQRETIERQIREGIEAALKGRHLVLEAVLIRNVRLPETIQEAINNKLEAEQQALKMQYVIAEAEAQQKKALMEVKAEAERGRIAAEGQAAVTRAQVLAAAEQTRLSAQAEADATRTTAEAGADAKRLDAKATADYEKLVNAYLSPQILRLREIEASAALASSPSAKFVLMGGKGAGTLLNLGGVLTTGAADPYK
jgi:regulator of protease activity HflC (stomatin/prohibitin superfamily)